MAEPRDENPIDKPRPNDGDQATERTGDGSPQNVERDDAVGRHNEEDIDPDSAESDVDRDDTVAD